MKVLIFGGRDFDDQPYMNAVLDRLHAIWKFTSVINGGQVSRASNRLFGADWQASVWASAHGMPPRYFYANWSGEGKAAGPLRNQRMADDKPDIGVQFPGGKGTRDMRRRLNEAGIQVIESWEVAFV